jgi:hypothetical protein
VAELAIREQETGDRKQKIGHEAAAARVLSDT